MMVRIWERGLPPAKLKSALLLEVSRVGFQAVRAIAGAYWSIARLFAGTKWERVDMSHLDMPTGHKKLSEDRKAFDLVLRHFHKPVYEIELEVTLNDQAGILNERYQHPSPNRREAFELPAWLRLADQSPDAAVMVGPHIVGLTELPGEAWEDLVVESANDIYADGRLFLPFAGDESASIQCVVPKRVN
jgi:hypothetical protein